MNVAVRTTSWTQARFLDWAASQEEPYEFDGDRPIAMTGGNAAHGSLIGNLNFSLRSRLRSGPCRSIPEAGVQTIGTAVRYPDALVTCAQVENEARLIPGAIILFEVIGPTSGRTDRIVKLREYAAIPTARRYVILESNAVGLTVLDRDHLDEPWRATTLIAGETLLLPEIGIEIPVDELYEGLSFAASDAPPA